MTGPLQGRSLTAAHATPACEHDLAYGPECMNCGQLMSPEWVSAYMPSEEPNRTYFEMYWHGPREKHAWCDPYGTLPRIEDEEGFCLGDCSW